MLDRHALHIGMIWRLRRVAAGLRQQDIAGRAGITTTRLSAIERGELEPSDLDRQLIERLLPEIPAVSLAEGRRQDLGAEVPKDEGPRLQSPRDDASRDTGLEGE